MAAAILRHVADAQPDRIGRRRNPDRTSVQKDLASALRSEAEDRLRKFRAAGTHQSSEPQNLAAPQFEIHTAQARFEHDFPNRHFPFRKDGRQLAAHHQVDESGARGVSHFERCHGIAVAQDSDAVRDYRDLFQPVRNVDDANALRLQRRDRLKQARHFTFGERRGGLVENEHLGLRADGLRDLDDLLLRHAERRHQAFGVDAARGALQQFPCADRARRPIDLAPETAAFERQRDILRNGQVWEQRRLLIHRGNAERARHRRAVVRDLFPADPQRAGIGRDRARHHLDQRGFPRAVLADQRVYFARAQLERDALQGSHTGVGFCDRPRFELNAHQEILYCTGCANMARLLPKSRPVAIARTSGKGKCHTAG